MTTEFQEALERWQAQGWELGTTRDGRRRMTHPEATRPVFINTERVDAIEYETRRALREGRQRDGMPQEEAAAWELAILNMRSRGIDQNLIPVMERRFQTDRAFHNTVIMRYRMTSPAKIREMREQFAKQETG